MTVGVPVSGTDTVHYEIHCRVITDHFIGPDVAVGLLCMCMFIWTVNI